MSEGGPGDASRERVAELERRIRLIEADEDDAYGDFTRLDWAICIVGRRVVLPTLAVVWFRP